MINIDFDVNNSIYSSWFEVFSAMLFPDSEERRDQSFDFGYYSFLIKKRNKKAYEFEKISYKKAAIKMTYLAWDEDFYNDFLERRRSVFRAGILTRLLFSLDYFKFPEPSMNKAIDLYSFKTIDRKKNSEKFGNKECIRTHARKDTMASSITHRNMLHYCAAYTIIKPQRSKSLPEFQNNMDQFLSLASGFKLFLLNYKPSRRGQYAPPFIEQEKLIRVSRESEVEPLTKKDLLPYPKEELEEYLTKASRL